MNLGRWCRLLVLAGLCLVPSTAAGAEARYHHAPEDSAILLPDPAVTPGQAVPMDVATLCATKWGLDARHVTERMKAQTYADYGAVKRKGLCCEVDHLVSRELGGADVQDNLWPQPWRQARMKDRVENWLHREVCAGRRSLATAQRAIARDWYRVYLEMLRERAKR